jgi:protein-disulfide isomerase
MDAALNNEEHWLADPVQGQDHSVGPAAAPITIVEYGDYECPDCLNAVPIIEEVRQNLGDRLRFVFRHFPQNSIHPHASVAAEAAEAAADQGKFWEMHKLLFKHQKLLADMDFSHLALTLGLEIYQFANSLSLQQHRQRIRDDYEGAIRSGAKKTPTLFINGRRLDGPINAKTILSAAQAALEESHKMGT